MVTSSEPATGHVFDGVPSALAGAPTVKNVNSADYELVGQTGKLTLQWDGVTVAPGQKAILDKATNKITVNEVETILTTSWKDGKLIFKNTKKTLYTEISTVCYKIS